MKKTTTIDWHNATTSPQTRRFVGAYIRKGRSEDKITFEVTRYLEDGHRPCETEHDGGQELCVAWAYYDDFVKGITPEMIKDAKAGAWPWWKEDSTKSNIKIGENPFSVHDNEHVRLNGKPITNEEAERLLNKRNK
jgi:hypothetical protein